MSVDGSIAVPKHQRMGRPSMTEIMEGRATSVAEAIVPGEDQLVLSVDTYGDSGAAFLLSVSADGVGSEECFQAHRDSDGTWAEVLSGGSGSGGWKTPWRPPTEGWDREPFATYGSIRHDEDDADGKTVDVAAYNGFVSPQAAAIEVRRDGQRRVVPVASPVGAFVVLAIGSGTVTLTALGPDQTPVGAPRHFEDNRRRRTPWKARLLRRKVWTRRQWSVRWPGRH